MAMQRLMPRWAITAIDLAMCLAALLAAYQLRFNFSVPGYEYDLLWPVLPIYVLVRLGWHAGVGIQRSMVRHTGTEDARRIFLTVLAGTLTLFLANAVRYYLVDHRFVLPTSVLIIEFMGAVMLLISSRIAFKLLHLKRKGQGKEAQRVVLFGAGEAGLITKRTLEREGSARYHVTAFVDDDPGKVGKRLEGVRVYSTSELPDLLRKTPGQQVIIAIQRPDPEHRRQVVDMAIAAQVDVRTVPPVKDWINGQLSSGQIREVRIEDLLGRAPINLEDAAVEQRFRGKRILVTGAAGSIGSEIARQLMRMGVAHATLLDQAESALYDLGMELQGRGDTAFGTVVGDVRNARSMEKLLAEAKPEVIFHAAAYKHVPLMEARPSEAALTNIGGTMNLAELAQRHGVKEFILISTDKAVNPTSVMGATKRCAELCVAALSEKSGPGMSVITTRFGNVLGSNGSVIPLFRKQIEAGGPVTVTDPGVVRYFMTIPEACRLVLEAATMGHGGEVYVFDMGQPVRISELAERMIRLSGKEPGRDIEVKYIGLRPGEKLYEELLADAESTLPTHHPRILIGKTTAQDPETTLAHIGTILEAATRREDSACVEAMKHLVPEYRSRNSPFSKFDPPEAIPQRNNP
ncbi:MAG: polysaccharide biosynthesis protein [Flavobacteriales bacterium]|jgi:FlaA1/EpsC-like NDP-sugar epimerase|nr:polysaccharide biosynthesis protein [Flavobacteriales bacterium]MCI1753450.1 polysaccharide biosynthesis protein [Flavobacteriales bacterium]